MNHTAVVARCMSLARLLSLLAMAALIWPARPANAQTDDRTVNVAVLNLESEATDSKLLSTLSAVLRNEAQQYGGYDIVNPSPVTLSEVAVVLGCRIETPSCLERAAAQLDARVLLYGRVHAADQARIVTIEIFDAATGHFGRRWIRTLSGGPDPVVDFRKQVQSIFASRVAARGTRVRIQSNVDGATVEFNGATVGTAPLTRMNLSAGPYLIEVHAKGYAPWQARIELVEDADVHLRADLYATAPTTSEIAPAGPTGGDAPLHPVDGTDGLAHRDAAVHPAQATNWAAWSIVGIGGAALGGSLAFGLLMGHAQNDVADLADRRQKMARDKYIARRQEIIDRGKRYETAHRVLLGVGAATAVAGAIWLLADDFDDAAATTDSRRWALGLAPGSASARIRW